jgi:serine protease AprX
MKKLLFPIFILTTFTVFPQTKYLIYFKDKGIEKGQSLNKTETTYQSAVNLLSSRAIERRRKVMGNNYITYEDFPIKSDYMNKIESIGIKIDNKLRWFNAVSAYLNSDQLNQVTSLPFVDHVSPVKVLYFRKTKLDAPVKSLQKISSTKDTSYGPSYDEYNLSDIPQARDKGIDGKSVIIGILDDGFMWKSHESLASRDVIAEYNFVFHDTSTAPQFGDAAESGQHGTFVFSLIGGYKPGKIIAPAYDAKFILAKTEDDRSESHIEEDNYAAALQWMESLGVDLTTSSLGYNVFDDSTYSYTYSDMDGKSTIVTKAADLAFQRGVLVFTAAGNEGDDSWKYVDAPADGFNVIAVGAVDSYNEVASFSSRGPTYDGRIKPDVVALGVNNYGADVANGYSAYDYGDGTSFATPIAAGIGAMLLSVYPEISNVQARNIILQSAENSQAPNNDIGYGLISAVNVLSFPVIDSTAEGYLVNKIFFDENNGLDTIDTNSVEIHFDNYHPSMEEKMLYDGKLKYTSKLSGTSLYPSTSLFYFTYSDNVGNNYRDPNGSEDYSVNYGSTTITFITAPQVNNTHPDELEQNYPNPFNLSKDKNTEIQYGVLIEGHVDLIIYNSLGEKIKQLVNTNDKPGFYTVYWDGNNEKGYICASGVYLCFLKESVEGTYVKKMIFLK